MTPQDIETAVGNAIGRIIFGGLIGYVLAVYVPLPFLILVPLLILAGVIIAGFIGWIINRLPQMVIFAPVILCGAFLWAFA